MDVRIINGVAGAVLRQRIADAVDASAELAKSGERLLGLIGEH